MVESADAVINATVLFDHWPLSAHRVASAFPPLARKCAYHDTLIPPLLSIYFIIFIRDYPIDY